MTAKRNIVRIRAPGTEDMEIGIFELRGDPVDKGLLPVLLVHGATIGATLFDLPLSGYSLMSELARVGRTVYALDIRGYGSSLSGHVMAAPPEMRPPFATLNDAVADIGAAVDLILAREGVRALDLVGFSWGTVTSGRYASLNPKRIARLVLYAPLYAEVNPMWLGRIADSNNPERLRPNLGAYRLVTQAELIHRWNSDLPTNDWSTYRESGVPELIFDSLAALDPLAQSRVPPAFRCPNGALADLVEIFNGRPQYDPAKLTMPVLLVRGADDTTSTDSDARQLLSAIAAADKNYSIVTPGSHFLCIEKNRFKLYEQLNLFLRPIEARTLVPNRIG